MREGKGVYQEYPRQSMLIVFQSNLDRIEFHLTGSTMNAPEGKTTVENHYSVFDFSFLNAVCSLHLSAAKLYIFTLIPFGRSWIIFFTGCRNSD